MVVALLVVFGLCLGSFVNALVWRVHEQDHETAKQKPSQKYLTQLSISKGRSMCSHCHHPLAAKDLVPVLSWLSVGGKCRYCRQPIPDSPLVELATGLLFVGSYLFWPTALHGTQTAVFVLWLGLVVGFMALLVYDLRWMLLPNRILYPLYVPAALLAIIEVVAAPHPLAAIVHTLLAVVIGGGIFYILFQVSAGKWIGGGDVKLGWLLGLIVGTPGQSILIIFLGSIIGTLISAPLMATKRLGKDSLIPFGPFLIIAAIIAQLFGLSILAWYKRVFLNT
jgi:prepilin signal peptidase PulO-like enzyme (type II secretory pathway)